MLIGGEGARGNTSQHGIRPEEIGEELRVGLHPHRHVAALPVNSRLGAENGPGAIHGMAQERGKSAGDATDQQEERETLPVRSAPGEQLGAARVPGHGSWHRASSIIAGLPLGDARYDVRYAPPRPRLPSSYEPPVDTTPARRRRLQRRRATRPTQPPAPPAAAPSRRALARR